MNCSKFKTLGKVVVITRLKMGLSSGCLSACFSAPLPVAAIFTPVKDVW